MVGIPHPLQMSAEDKAAWGEIWADYEIIPPFPQLGRSINVLDVEERNVTDLARFSHGKVPAPTLIFGLEKLGWLRAIPADAGHFWEHTKAFPSANVTAVIEYEPGSFPYGIQQEEPQKIEHLFFAPGIHEPRMYSRWEKKLKWGDVDPVVVSEVLSDLISICAKEK